MTEQTLLQMQRVSPFPATTIIQGGESGKHIQRGACEVSPCLLETGMQWRGHDHGTGARWANGSVNVKHEPSNHPPGNIAQQEGRMRMKSMGNNKANQACGTIVLAASI